MPEAIASPRNPLLKEVRKAIARGALTSDGFAVAESFHLYEEAIRSGCEIRAVLVSQSALERLQPSHLMRVLPDALFTEIAATETSQGIMTLVKPPVWTIESFPTGLLIALDGIQDPGNAGTIVRSAEAFGAAGVLFLKGSVCPYNPKALRASAGSAFRLPVLTGIEPKIAQNWFAQNGLPVFAALPGAAAALDTIDFTNPAVVVIGSEGRGVSETILKSATPFTIPTQQVESLNAAVAASVILYEAARQRRQK